MTRETTGLLVVYTGQGKGKTTAALGAVFRALGQDMQVAVIQFIKGAWQTGERKRAATLDDGALIFEVAGAGFTWNSDDLSVDAAKARAGWTRAVALIASGECDLVVLDELTYALNYGFIPVQDVLTAFAERPAHVHVIITGRRAPDALIDVADLVTEMTNVKHPHARGVPAQPGLDF